MTIENQEVVNYMTAEFTRNRDEYSDPFELAAKVADMFDLYADEEWEEVPEWLYDEAEDIFHGNY